MIASTFPLLSSPMSNGSPNLAPSVGASMTQSQKAFPKDLLSELVDQKFSGKLSIQNPFDELVDWQIFMGNGKIHFASSSVGNGKRLNYMLGSIFNQTRITIPEQVESDYEYICELWKKKIFSFQQTRSILTQFTQEALVQTLSLPKTQYQIDANDKLKHLFLNLSLEQTVSPIQKKIRYWWELRSEINSPFQRPLVQDWRQIHEAVTQVTGPVNQNFWTLLHQSLENLNCLYDIASRTQLSTLQLAIAFRNLIKSGEIVMLPYQEIASDDRPLVISIDDNQARQRIVKYTLEKSGYRVTGITDPFKALATLQSQNPDLILINGDIGTMDGYQLTSLCRKSPQLKTIPILIMIEQDNLIDRIKGKMSGANDSLPKPFLPKELLAKIQEHAPTPSYGYSRLHSAAV